MKVPQADNVQLFGHSQKIKRLQQVQQDGGDVNKSLLKVSCPFLCVGVVSLSRECMCIHVYVQHDGSDVNKSLLKVSFPVSFGFCG